MNQIIKNLHSIKEKMRAQWNKLTDDDIEKSKGDVDDLQGRLKKAYGYNDEQARREFDDFTSTNGVEFEETPAEEEPLSPATPIVPRDNSKIIQ